MPEQPTWRKILRKLAGALTLLGDVLKTVLAVVIGRALAGD